MDRIISVENEGLVPVLMNKYNGDEPPQQKPPRGGKTWEWIEALHKKDFIRRSYYNGKNYGFPAMVIEGAIATSAKAFRKGLDFKRYVTVVEDWIPILVPHGTGWREVKETPEELYEHKEYVSLMGVVIGRYRVDRCRPQFNNWRLRYTLFVNETKLDLEQVKSAAETMIVGDFRPRYGRCKLISFVVEEQQRKGKGA